MSVYTFRFIPVFFLIASFAFFLNNIYFAIYHTHPAGIRNDSRFVWSECNYIFTWRKFMGDTICMYYHFVIAPIDHALRYLYGPLNRNSTETVISE